MIFIMNIINMIFDLNKILQLFITQITALESTVLKLQAAFDKTNIIFKQICSVVQEVSSKSISTVRNSYTIIARLTVHNITMNVCIMIDEKTKVTNLFYTSACSMKCQNHIIREKCFNCSQKKHTQKNYLMHLFEKICFLLNSELNQSINSVS